MRNILIVGGGFAGVWAAMGAARALHHSGGSDKIRVTLISRDPYLTIRPRLYEASLDKVRIPLDAVLKPIGVERLEGEVTVIDANAKTVTMSGRTLSYDRLILAAGSQLHRPEIPGLAEYAFSVDTYEEAVRLERHLTAAPNATVVVAGAGLTGLEVATEMVPRLKRLGRSNPRVILVERSPRVAPGLGDEARAPIEEALQAAGVETRLGAAIVAVDREGVCLSTGEVIPAATLVWSVGMRANPLTQLLPVAKDPLGRLSVDRWMRVDGLDGVLAAGDLALAMTDGVHPALMSCQHAMPQGAVAGHNAVLGLLGKAQIPYEHRRYVTCIDLGEWGGLFTTGWDRSVRYRGREGKAMKRLITEHIIYPPLTGRREAIFKAADPRKLLGLDEETKGGLQRWIEQHLSPSIALFCLRSLTACSELFRMRKTWSRRPSSAGQSPT